MKSDEQGAQDFRGFSFQIQFFELGAQPTIVILASHLSKRESAISLHGENCVEYRFRPLCTTLTTCASVSVIREGTRHPDKSNV